MRPRKVLLLVCADEIRSSVLGLVLDTHGYRVVPAASMAAAMELVKAASVAEFAGAWLCDTCPDVDRAGVLWLKRTAPEMKLLATLSSPRDWSVYADVCADSSASMVLVLERLRILLSLKRGPKKRVAEPQAA